MNTTENMNTMENVSTQDRLRYVAKRISEGAGTDEIAIELKAPKLAIENTVKLIQDLYAIMNSQKNTVSEPEEKEDEGEVDFIELTPIVRAFIRNNFAGACITAEYGDNVLKETEVHFSTESGDYSVFIQKEEPRKGKGEL